MYCRLNKLAICISHTTILNMVKALGVKHDQDVMKWKNEVSCSSAASIAQRSQRERELSTVQVRMSGDEYSTDDDEEGYLQVPTTDCGWNL